MTTSPAGGGHHWGGRLPLADPTALDDDQRSCDQRIRSWAAAAERAGIVTSTDGRLIGPFNALVLRPRPGTLLHQWVDAGQADSVLPDRVREIVILTVGVAWQSDYEIYAHVALARQIGLPEAVIDGLRAGTPNEALTGHDLAAHRFTDQLVRAHHVDEETYRDALAAFGQHGVLDLVYLIGMYLTTSALLNAFEVPAPPIPQATQP